MNYDLYRTSSKTITPIGDKCPYSYMYYLSGGEYHGMNMSNYYKAGSDVTYYTRSKYASAGELYWPDGEETVSVGTNEYASPLYTAGEAYDALYTNFELAKLTTRNVTALTV